MRKFIIFFVAIILSFSTTIFVGCDNGKTIRVNEVTHSIFYAPFYVAINNGYFEEEGYKIELTNGGGSDASMTALLSGSADIALMGPETNVYVVSQGKQDYPVIFGQLTKRDGSFLVGRTEEPEFDWSNLKGKHFIAGRRGGSPAMSLQYALEKNGYDIETDLNFDLSIAFNNTVGAFESGTGDYVTVFEPTASELVRNGKGYIVASVGEESGEVPFTCFSANKSFMEKNPDKIEMFLKCIIRAYNFIMTENIDKVVESLAPSFVGTSKESIKASITSYKEIDAWMSTPIMLESAFNRLQDVMVGAGELKTENRVSFEKVVDNSYAQNVLDKYFN
ncbi:MAG: ABC transporter substrate-binding protein [Clostridiales bacterium]|nr:ABC transporter substrate-binding protein [Candidatus Apopatousia equi]